MIFPPVVLWIPVPKKWERLDELLQNLRAARSQNGGGATIEALNQFLKHKLVIGTRETYHFTPKRARIIASRQLSSSSSKQRAIDDLLKLESRVKKLKKLTGSKWSKAADAFFAITVWRVSVLFEAFYLQGGDVHIHPDNILEQLNRDRELLERFREILKMLRGDTWPIDLLRVSIDLFRLLREGFPSAIHSLEQRLLLDKLFGSASALFGIQPDPILQHFNTNTLGEERRLVAVILDDLVFIDDDHWSIENLPRALWELLPHLLSIRTLVGDEAPQ